MRKRERLEEIALVKVKGAEVETELVIGKDDPTGTRLIIILIICNNII